MCGGVFPDPSPPGLETGKFLFAISYFAEFGGAKFKVFLSFSGVRVDSVTTCEFCEQSNE